MTDVSARIALVGDDLHAGGVGGFFERVVDEIAPGVVIADIADRLDAGCSHPLDHGFHHHGRWLRNGNHPRAGVARYVSGRCQCDQWDFQFVRDRGDCERCRRGARAHQNVDLVLLDQLAGIARTGRRIGGIIELNGFDFDAVDLAFVDEACGKTFGIGNPDRGAGTGHRGYQANSDVCGHGREGYHRGDGRNGGETQGMQHAHLPNRRRKANNHARSPSVARM